MEFEAPEENVWSRIKYTVTNILPNGNEEIRSIKFLGLRLLGRDS